MKYIIYDYCATEPTLILFNSSSLCMISDCSYNLKQEYGGKFYDDTHTHAANQTATK